MKCAVFVGVIGLILIAGIAATEYEAYEVREFSQNDGCDRETCKIKGFVNTDGTASSAAQAVVFSVADQDGQMQLLGTKSVSSGKGKDTVDVNFNWRGSTQVVLMYVYPVAASHSARLKDEEGKNTRRFCLGAFNVCQLHRSSASIIENKRVSASLYLAIPPASDSAVTSACVESPTICPSSTAVGTTSTSDVAASTASSSGDSPTATSAATRTTSHTTPAPTAGSPQNITGASSKPVTSAFALVSAVVIAVIVSR